MAYTKTNWQDLPNNTTPINATRLNNIENGVENNDKRLNGTSVAGKMVVESIRTKNIFGDYVLQNGWIDNTNMNIHTLGNNRLACVPCKPNTTYSISRSVITTQFKVGSYAGDNIPLATSTDTNYPIQQVITNNSGTEITYTTNSTAKWLIIHYGYVLNDTAEQLKNCLASIQVEEGSSVTSFTPYQSLNKEIKDSNWVFPTLTSDFVKYGNNFEPRYRKIGNIVDIVGIIKTTSDLASNLERTIFTLPEEYRPHIQHHFLCQGSGMNHWLLTINENGTVTASRYGINSQDTIPTTAWLPFNAMFFVG